MIQTRWNWCIMDDDTCFTRKAWLNSGGKRLNEALESVTSFNRALDIGAHYGTWARPMCDRFKFVEAFEGRKSVYDCLVRNMKGIKNTTLHHTAIGDRFDHVNIELPPEPNAVGNSGMGTITGSGSIPMVPIDSFGFDDVSFIKIDVEGYEMFVLKGAEETLKRCRPVVVFEEVDNQAARHGIAVGACGAYLESLGATYLGPVKPHDKMYGWK